MSDYIWLSPYRINGSFDLIKDGGFDLEALKRYPNSGPKSNGYVFDTTSLRLIISHITQRIYAYFDGEYLSSYYFERYVHLLNDFLNLRDRYYLTPTDTLTIY